MAHDGGKDKKFNSKDKKKLLGVWESLEYIYRCRQTENIKRQEMKHDFSHI